MGHDAALAVDDKGLGNPGNLIGFADHVLRIEQDVEVVAILGHIRLDRFPAATVSQDRRGREAVEPYVAKNGYHFNILLDPQNVISETYEVAGVPETFIIDRKGRIVAHHMGAFDWSRADVKDALRELLNSNTG